MKVFVNNDSIKLEDIKIFVCVPGLGKTYMSLNYDGYIDLDRIRSNYKYDIDENFDLDIHEKSKGKNRAVVNSDYNDFIFKKIQTYLYEDKILLLAPNEEIMEWLTNNKISYCLIYNHYKLCDVFVDRFKSRGNNFEFINKNVGKKLSVDFYEKHIMDRRPAYKIEVISDLYLEDIFRKIMGENYE